MLDSTIEQGKILELCIFVHYNHVLASLQNELYTFCLVLPAVQIWWSVHTYIGQWLYLLFKLYCTFNFVYWRNVLQPALNRFLFILNCVSKVYCTLCTGNMYCSPTLHQCTLFLGALYSVYWRHVRQPDLKDRINQKCIFKCKLYLLFKLYCTFNFVYWRNILQPAQKN